MGAGHAARQSELKLTNALPVWIIPGDRKVAGEIVAGRTKNHQDQVVPLSCQSVGSELKSLK